MADPASSVKRLFISGVIITIPLVATLASVIGVFLLVGLVAEYTPGTYLSKQVHATMETIPGVSTVYESVRRASKLLVEDESDQFKDVKLVEFPHEGAYMLGFLTAETPPWSRPARARTRW